MIEVELSAAAEASFSQTITELTGLGYQRADRKYLVWCDSDVYCGIGT